LSALANGSKPLYQKLAKPLKIRQNIEEAHQKSTTKSRLLITIFVLIAEFI
jgi:hypothetical protein